MKIRTLVIASALLMLTNACTPPAANNSTTNSNAGNKAANTNATAPVNTAAVETDVKTRLTDLAASMVKNDAAAAEKAYSDNYMFVGPDGSIATKAERIAAMKSGETKYDVLTYDEVSVRSNPDGNGAVSISRAHVQGKNMGKDVDGYYRVTHVWTKTADGWKMASGQTTKIAEAGKEPEKSVNANKNAEPAANK